jgi:hypothetical protein
MAEHDTPVEMARLFTEAWTSHDMDKAASYLADGVVFDGPNSRTTGVDDYLKFLDRFASTVTSAKILASHGDENEAVIMYEVTNQQGTWTCAELLAFGDGRIQRDTLTFSLNAR